MNDRSSTRSIRRRKWSSATNDSKSILTLAFGSNACTPCMAASILENSDGRITTPLETQSAIENQAESESAKLLFFNRPRQRVRHVINPRVFDTRFSAHEIRARKRLTRVSETGLP